MRTWIVAISLLFSGMCLAGTIDPSSKDQDHLDYAAGFPCVIEIRGICKCGGDHEFHASAVAISPHWALTAAHVVEGNKGVYVKIGDRKFPSDKVFVHEKFSEDSLGFADIALCRFRDDLGLDFYPELYDGDDEVSKVASISGYGVTGNFSTGHKIMDQRRRAGSNIIAAGEKDVLICNLSDRKTKMEFLIAPGDSGGGLFIGKKLAGINSFVSAEDGKPDSDYGDESAHTRVSKFVEWIRENTKD